MECKKLRPSKTATLDFVPVPRKIGDSLDVALEDHEDRCRPAAGEPCSSSSSGVAHLSMTSLCRVGDAGLDSNNDSLDVSIEETRDRSPRLFAFEDSSTLFREYLPPLRRTRRKPVLTEMSPVKNSTMNQSAMEAFSLHIDSVSPIDDENRKRRSAASPVDAHESIILQEKSAVEASATHDVPGHVRRFWRKIRTRNKVSPGTEQRSLAHEDSNNNEGESAKSASINSSRRTSADEWLIPERRSGKTLRTYCKADRRAKSDEPNDDGRDAIRGEFICTGDQPGGAVSPGKRSAPLEVSSIHECLADSVVPLGREAMKKNTVNSDELHCETPERIRVVDQSMASLRESESVTEIAGNQVVNENDIQEVDYPVIRVFEPDDKSPPVPVDEVALQAINSPRHIRIYNSTPVKPASTRSVPNDEIGDCWSP